MNVTIGIGQDDCLNGDEKYIQKCPTDAGTQWCHTEMQIDWNPRGFHTYGITRGCSPMPAKATCQYASASLVQTVYCQVDCDSTKDGEGCNSGLEEVAMKLYNPDGVTNCYTCSFTEDNDGNVIGQQACGEEITGGSDVKSLECPMYATASCFHAAAIHANTSDGGEFTDDFRGCSPFVEDRDQYCESASVSGVDSINCRETCDTTDCNTDKIQKHRQCYNCVATRDSDGNPVGLGDDRCFEGLHDGLLMDCEGDDYCMDEMWVDWQLKGGQEVEIRRGCSSTAAIPNCPSMSTDEIKFKNCYLSCSGDACNNDLTVGDKFVGDYKETSCYNCKYTKLDNGDVEGNENCPKGAPDSTMECPNYASAGCYTGASAHDIEGERMDEVYKGCSSFEIEGGVEMHDIMTDDVSYSITKTTCRGENCNPDHISPEDGGITPPSGNGTMCHVCSVTVNQFNETTGSGSAGCWEGGSYLEECNAGSWCSTELEVDWYAKGAYTYRLIRGCSAVEAPVNCYNSQSDLIQIKDCTVTCNPEEDGAGCNSGLDEVADKFDEGNDIECISCQYARDADGNILNGSNEKCSGDDVSGDIDSISCPKYANAACYTASSWHTVSRHMSD